MTFEIAAGAALTVFAFYGAWRLAYDAFGRLIQRHRCRFRFTGYWSPAIGNHAITTWFAQACECGEKRIVTGTYDILPWDDLDDAQLRRGEWKYDDRLLDAEVVAATVMMVKPNER